MQWFIINRDLDVVAASATDSKDSIFIDDSSSSDGQKITLTDGVAVGEYNFQTDPRHEDSKYITAGNFIAFKDKYNRYRMYTIMSTSSDDTMDVHAEDIGLDLINGISTKWDYSKNAQSLNSYVQMITTDSDWTVVVDGDLATEKRELKFDNEETKLKRLENVMLNFDCECDFEIKMEGSKVTSNVIHVQKKVGRNVVVNKFINDVNLSSLKYSNDISSLYNCIIPTGSNNVTIKDIQYDDGRFVSPKGENRLYDTVSRKTWYRYRYHTNETIGLYDGYICSTKSYSAADTPVNLFDQALKDLKASSDIKVSAEANVLDLDADLGDYVELVDTTNQTDVYLKARVQAVNNHYTVSKEDTGTLANYELMKPNPVLNFQTMLKELINAQVSISKSTVSYQVGDSGTIAPTGEWNSAVPKLEDSKFLWSRTVLDFSDGSSSTSYSVSTSTKGATGKSIKKVDSYFGLSTSATTEPASYTKELVQMDPVNKYLWNYTVIIFDDNTTNESTHCVIGAYGNTGADGKDGKDGTGVTSIVEYYAVNNTIDIAPTSWSTSVKTTSKDNRYLWNYELTTYSNGRTDSDDPRIIGTYGDTGLGIKDIVNYYLATDASTGVTIQSSGWTTTAQNPTKDKNFLWNYEKVTYTDSSYINSPPCIIGKWAKDGIGIASTVTLYLASNQSKGVTIADAGWTTTVQYATKALGYLWSYESVTYSDSSVRNSDPHVIGMYAESGKDGTRGSIIWTTTVEPIAPNYTFTISNLKNTKSIGAPIVGDLIFFNYFYYTITGISSTTVLADNKTNFRGETGAKGADGSQGTPGKAGADGKTPYLHTAYSWSADGTDRFMTVYPGENLFLNSKSLEDRYDTNQGAKVTLEPFDSTTNMWHIVSEQGTIAHTGIYLFNYGKGKLPDTTDWSYSVDIKGTGKIERFGIEIGNVNPVVGTVGTEWSHISQTGRFDNPPFKTLIMCFDTTNSPVDVYIKLPKLEVDKMPTSYTPSPLDDPEGAYPKFIGTYTDFEPADSTDPKSYKWALIKGRGVKSITPQYYLSTSETEMAGGSWSNTKPIMNNISFLWTRQHVIYTDNTEEYSSGIYDPSLTDLFQVTTKNSTNITRTDTAITATAATVTEIQNANTDLSKKLQSTTASLSDKIDAANAANSDTKNDLKDYKESNNKEVNEMRTTVSQTSDAIGGLITFKNNSGAAVTLASTFLKSDGLHVDTNGTGTESVINGAGLFVEDKERKITVARFSSTKSEVENMSVGTFLSFGSHRAETLAQTEWDGTKVNGTAYFWVDDVTIDTSLPK
jgi:hypothetical protein